ncbi:MAG TPA: hypothetical protein VHB77_20650 [Planctomycetaceae bacterium]|nr:hypothetical protein [Planctomycetaceae bacterium]
MVRSIGCIAVLIAALCAGCARHRGDTAGYARVDAPVTPHVVSRKPAADPSEPIAWREHEFEENSTRLNGAGEEHLSRIADELLESPRQVALEPVPAASEPDADRRRALDEQRRDVLVQRLLAMGIADSDSRVVIAAPQTASRFKPSLPKLF